MRDMDGEALGYRGLSFLDGAGGLAGGSAGSSSTGRAGGRYHRRIQRGPGHGSADPVDGQPAARLEFLHFPHGNVPILSVSAVGAEVVSQLQQVFLAFGHVKAAGALGLAICSEVTAASGRGPRAGNDTGLWGSKNFFCHPFQLLRIYW